MAAAPPRAAPSRSTKKGPAATVFAKPTLPAARPARRTAAPATDRSAPLAARTPGANVDKATLPQQQQAAPTAPAAASAPVPVPSKPLGDVAPEWYKTYRKAFPSFVFYFHDMDQKNTRIFTRFTLLLGGAIEPFFSKKVTHLITGGLIPANYVMSKPPPHQQQLPEEPLSFRASQGPAPHQASSRKPAECELPADQRLLQRRNQGIRRPAEDKENRPTKFLSTRHVIGQRKAVLRSKIPVLTKRSTIQRVRPPSPKPDITAKAVEMKIKIWGIEKYTKVLSALMNPSAFDDSARPSLRITLRDEKVLGPSAVYRPMKDYYILSEDATGVYRPMIAREYVPTAKDREPWAHLRPRQKAQCPFSKPGITHESQAEGKPDGSKQKKSGAACDRTAERQLNPRASAVAVPKVNPPRRTAGKDVRAIMPLPMAPSANASGIVAVGSGVSTANAVTSVQLAGPGAASKEIQQDKMDQLVGKTVPMFQKPKARLKSASAPSKSAVRQGMADGVTEVEAKKKEADVKLPRRAGFCENCYAKFEDMEKHIRSKQHRDFATDPANFRQLAALVEAVARVPRQPSPVRRELESEKEGDHNDVRELDTDIADAEGRIVDEETEDDAKVSGRDTASSERYNEHVTTPTSAQTGYCMADGNFWAIPPLESPTKPEWSISRRQRTAELLGEAEKLPVQQLWVTEGG